MRSLRPLITCSIAALAAVLALSRSVSAQSDEAPPAPRIPAAAAMPNTGDWRDLLSEMRSATAELRETVVLAQAERGKLDATIRVAQASPSATVIPNPPAAPAPPAPVPPAPTPQYEQPALTPNPAPMQAATTTTTTTTTTSGPATRRPGPIRQFVALTGDGLVAVGTALGHAGDTRVVQRIPRARTVRTAATSTTTTTTSSAAPQQAAVTPSAQTEASTGLFRR